MIISKSEVDSNLLIKYVNIVKMMEISKGDINLYETMDKMRQDIHKMIKKEADPDDSLFDLELGTFVEQMIFSRSI